MRSTISRAGGQVVHRAAVQVTVVDVVAARRIYLQDLLDCRPQLRHLVGGAQRIGTEIPIAAKSRHLGAG